MKGVKRAGVPVPHDGPTALNHGVAFLPDNHNFDAYAPQQIADRVNDFALVKARMPLLTLWMLGMLAGAFIGLGAMLFALVASDASLGFAAKRLLGGVAFSLGLILVTVAGAELFTGNNLLAMAWASGRVSAAQVLRNWLVVGLANFAGAAGLAVLVWLSGHTSMNDGAVGRAVHRHRQQQGAVVAGRGVLSRRVMQRACLHGGVDGAGRAQRHRQGAGARATDHRLRRCRLRALDCQPVLLSVGDAAGRSAAGLSIGCAIWCPWWWAMWWVAACWSHWCTT